MFSPDLFTVELYRLRCLYFIFALNSVTRTNISDISSFLCKGDLIVVELIDIMLCAHSWTMCSDCHALFGNYAYFHPIWHRSSTVVCIAFALRSVTRRNLVRETTVTISISRQAWRTVAVQRLRSLLRVRLGGAVTAQRQFDHRRDILRRRSQYWHAVSKLFCSIPFPRTVFFLLIISLMSTALGSVTRRDLIL